MLSRVARSLLEDVRLLKHDRLQGLDGPDRNAEVAGKSFQPELAI